MNKGKSAAGPSPEAIGRRAYELYEARGRLPGHELEDWLAAEAELRGSGTAAGDSDAPGTVAAKTPSRRKGALPEDERTEQPETRGSPSRRRPVERRP